MAEEITKPPEMLEADRVANEAMKEHPVFHKEHPSFFTTWCLIRNAWLMGRGYGIKQERDRK